MFLGFDPVTFEHTDLPVAGSHRHSDRRRWTVQARGRLGPAVLPRGRLLLLGAIFSRLTLVVLFGGRDIITVMIVHHPGVVQRRLLIAVVAGLPRMQHTPIRCQPVNCIRFRRSRIDILKWQMRGSNIGVPRTRARTRCHGSATEFPLYFETNLVINREKISYRLIKFRKIELYEIFITRV